MTNDGITAAGIAIEPVTDGWFRCSPDVVLTAPPEAPADWTTSGWWGAEGWQMPLGGFVLRLPDRTVLVDCGIGERHEPDVFESGDLPAGLAARGVAPGDVTDVVLTHLHIDHIGWISHGGTPTFPNAVHHLHELEWAALRDHPGEGIENEGLTEAMSPVADLLRLVSGDRNEVLPDITLRLAPGHTVGNCLVEVGTGEDRAYLLGDSAHHPATLVEDGWLDNFDVDRDGARRLRAALADEIERDGIRVVGAHFDDLQFGRVVRRDGKRAWEPVV